MATEQIKQQGRVNMTLQNQTPTTMTLDRYHNWSGSAGCLPNGIPAENEVKIVHLKKGEYGSKAALQFSGKNAAGVHCAWLLAWDAPSHMIPFLSNRVFAICGAKQAIDAINLEEIKFPAPGTGKVSYHDTLTQTKIDAIIDQNTSIANLLGSFGLM